MSKNFKHELEKLVFTYQDSKITVIVTVHDVTLEVYSETFTIEETPASQEDFINRCKQIFENKIQDCWKYGI